MPYARRANSDEPKPLEHDFTAYDTPSRDIHEADQHCSRAWLTSASLQLSRSDQIKTFGLRFLRKCV
jgi:hypothetical protein